MYSKEEILKALKVIKNNCKEQEHCDTCPLRVFDEDCYNNYGCYLLMHGNPSEWKIKAQEETWRAFED